MKCEAANESPPASRTTPPDFRGGKPPGFEDLEDPEDLEVLSVCVHEVVLLCIFAGLKDQVIGQVSKESYKAVCAWRLNQILNYLE